MTLRRLTVLIVGIAGLAIFFSTSTFPLDLPETVQVKVQWDRVIRVSKTSGTLQVVPSPAHHRGSAFHDRIWGALRDLKCSYVRYSPWYPYLKLVVAELEPPHEGKTWWDFTLIDPLTGDFLDAMAGRPVIMDSCTIPQWMFKCRNQSRTRPIRTSRRLITEG